MIPYVTKSWNPIDGCTPVSEGCKNCWADDMAHRFWGERKFSQVTYHQDRLMDPFHWRKPQTVAVSFMGDLFHEDIAPVLVSKIFAVMALLPQHRFLVLTKRASKMKTYLSTPAFLEFMGYQAKSINRNRNLDELYNLPVRWPLSNVWLGVTAENQRRADERIPFLMDTPAARRWVSIEPMLGPVLLARLPCGPDWFQDVLTGYHYKTDFTDEQYGCAKLDAVIAGCESGPKKKRRRTDMGWLINLEDACKDEDIPVFIKQWEAAGKIIRANDFTQGFWK